MTICIYCERDVPLDKITLEHTIPQFLGGELAPKKYQVKSVCRECNNNLGQFVDASFEKDHIVTSWMRQAAFDCYDFSASNPLPLIHMGVMDIDIPGMREGEVCENYLGPFGELVLWVRPNDESLYWYVGGNPRTTKKVNTRAYFFVNERSIRPRNQPIVWNTFRAAFPRRRVKKILCIDSPNPIPNELGFAARDELDDKRIACFRENPDFLKNVKGNFSVNIQFDARFMSKLARGVGYALFGERSLVGPYASEVYRGIWCRQHSENLPEIRGAGIYAQMGRDRMGFLGRKGAVVISVINTGNAIALDLRIGKNIGSTVMCMEGEQISRELLKEFGCGIVLVIFKYMNKAFEFRLGDYIMHITGSKSLPELAGIDAVIDSNVGKFAQL